MIDLSTQAATLGGEAVVDGELPASLPVLPLRETVPFPDSLTPLAVGQDRSVQLVNDVLQGDRRLVMVASRVPDDVAPGPNELHGVGVAGTVARMLRVPDGTLRILVQGAQRVRLDRFSAELPYLVADVSALPDVLSPSSELTALQRNVQQAFSRIVQGAAYLPEDLQIAVANLDDPIALSHFVAGVLRLSTDDKQGLLEEVDVTARLRLLVDALAEELEVISIGTSIQEKVQSDLDRNQREFVLRQLLMAIQDELGETDEATAEANELRERLAAVPLPEDARRQADRELGRLENLPTQAAEHGVIRTYLEWIASLPWGEQTDDDLDLGHAREILDADHFGLEQVKDRILEFLAVRRLVGESAEAPAGSILCFVGPPGVGKTSLGRSIARALGRRFERISVGGVRDEAEIRGHRRTYIGAMPGVVIRALRDAGARNPLFMIDEIDKMGADFRGDPSSAMLEVLDPEQNASFRDHYLDLPFDLSAVMFVCTANDLDGVPGPLRDRMEIIQLAGYSEDEKLQIAKRYLVNRQLVRSGLKRSQLQLSDAGLRAIISDYTREAGVRQLEREIGAVARKIARQVAEGEVTSRARIGEARVRDMLGRRRFFTETRRRTSQPGVATGLAWTPVGGDVLFIEATAMPGRGGLTITGQIGDVMRESAQAALSYVRGHVAELAPGLPSDWFATHDLHVHVPAGAIPKDGPSAGITMATALTSLVTGRPVRGDVAMTGEITLTGQVLPIGGLKEKVLAAQRYGVRHIVAPARNEQDIEDVPEHVRGHLEFTFVDGIAEVLEVALEQPRGRAEAA
ncbi:MAG: endopeptidase La [Solirubrobacterales bacterium]|nr:endopeptidase La [Solirubrobacterales bacterium]